MNAASIRALDAARVTKLIVMVCSLEDAAWVELHAALKITELIFYCASNRQVRNELLRFLETVQRTLTCQVDDDESDSAGFAAYIRRIHDTRMGLRLPPIQIMIKHKDKMFVEE